MENDLTQCDAEKGWFKGVGPLVFVLALITAAVFIRVGSATFVDLDDDLYVTGNPHVLGGLNATNAAWAFQVGNAGWWIPLTWLSLQLDATLAGPGATSGPKAGMPNAALFHLDNLMLHLVATVFLFLALYRSTRRRWASFVVALIWAIHPLRVESVAWVTERKDVLAIAFGFIAMYFYIAWRERGGWGRYTGICVALGLSLTAKIAFVTLPALLILLDIWPLGRMKGVGDAWRLVKEKIPIFLISLAGMIMAFYAQSKSSSIQTLANVGFSPRIENAMLSYVRYMWMQVSVARLAPFYPYLGRAPEWRVAGAAGILVAITGLAIWQRSRRPWLIVGWLWYLGTLVPLIGLIQIGEQAYADRFTYLPAVGLMIIVVWSIPAVWFSSAAGRKWLAGVVAAAALIFAAFTIRQVEFWQNSISLLEQSTLVTERNYFLLANLGTAYMQAERPLDAEAAYRRSVEINPGQAMIQLNLGMLYLQERRVGEAMGPLSAAVAQAPDNAAAHDVYGAALAMAGRMDDAVVEFGAAVRLNPGDEQSRQNLVHALAAQAQRHGTLPSRPQ